jgi:hypothetical protein
MVRAVYCNPCLIGFYEKHGKADVTLTDAKSYSKMEIQGLYVRIDGGEIYA